MQILDLRLLKKSPNGEQCVIEGSLTALLRTPTTLTARLSTGYMVTLSADELSQLATAPVRTPGQVATQEGGPQLCRPAPSPSSPAPQAVSSS